MGDSRFGQGLDPSVDKSVLPVWVPRSVSVSRLLEVILLLNNTLITPTGNNPSRSWELLSIPGRIKPRREVINLLIPVREVHVPIVAIVVISALGSIDREEHIVRAKPVAVSVGISKDPSLEHLIVGEVNSRNDVSWIHGQHLVFGEEIVDVLVQHHPAHRLQGDLVLRPDLSGIQGIEIEPVLVIRIHHLNEKLPLGIIPGGDRFVQILSGVAVIGAADPRGLILEETLDAAGRLPMELDVIDLAGFVDQSESMDAESLHVPVIGRNPDVIVKPGEGIEALREVRQVIEDPPILLDMRFRVRLERMDHFGELGAVPDEEHGEVVPNQIEVPLAGVELDGEAARVADGLGAAALVDDGGEAGDERGLDAGRAEEIGAGEVGDVVRDLEEALGACPPRVDNSFRDSLPSEIGYLLHQVIIF